MSWVQFVSPAIFIIAGAVILVSLFLSREEWLPGLKERWRR